jgi:hypothetical protein
MKRGWIQVFGKPKGNVKNSKTQPRKEDRVQYVWMLVVGREIQKESIVQGEDFVQSEPKHSAHERGFLIDGMCCYTGSIFN